MKILLNQFLCALLLMISLSVKGQSLEPLPGDGRLEIMAFKLADEQTIKLDGSLDDEIWSQIMPITDFFQQEPHEGAPCTEKTEIRIAYDKDNLYIGVMLYDSNPNGVLAFQKRRDGDIRTDDRFIWILDTFEDGRNAYFFEINPAGLMGDALVRSGQGFNFNKAWNGIWQAWVKRGAYGWSAEIRIPFRTLDFNPNKASWGINFQRTIRRKNEEALWSGHRRHQGIFRPQDAGRLTGLEGLSQGIGLEVKPYAIASGKQNEDEKASPGANAGLDVNYNITSNLRAAITINTDFAEAEVDQRQVNLTRFPLFFPERRDFFLEGSGLFQFAPNSGEMPYFSRRIGLNNGKPIPITYGGRLTGRIGDYNIGLLQVRTASVDSIPAENFTVGRVSKNLGRESSIGVIYTRRAIESPKHSNTDLQDRHTIGSDLELNTSKFLGNKNLQFQTYFLMHNAEFKSDSIAWHQLSARGARISFPNNPWHAHIAYNERGDAYDPAVGFTPRRSFRSLQPSIIFSPLVPNSKIIREFVWRIDYENLMDLNFQPATTNLNFNLLGIRFETGDFLWVNLCRNYERLDESFDIRRDGTVIIPRGDYYNWQSNIYIETASFRPIVGGGYLYKDGFWSGIQQGYGVELTLRPFPGINISGEFNHNQILLAEGQFDTNIFRFTGNFDLSPWVSFTTNLQYDNLSHLLGLNARMRWIVRPGNDLFLVYNHNWIHDIKHAYLYTLERQGIVKASFTHRF
jgi:hypothetical protein